MGPFAGRRKAASIIRACTGTARPSPRLFFITAAFMLVEAAGRLLTEAFHILMEGAPRGVSLKNLDRELRAIDGVSDVHELHVWSLSSGFNALSAHLVVKDPAKQQAALKAATCGVAAGFGIRHSVFQVEAVPVENSSCDICVH